MDSVMETHDMMLTRGGDTKRVQFSTLARKHDRIQ